MADATPAGDAPFLLWRSAGSKPEEVFARGTVHADGQLTVSWVPIGAVPDPRSINLADLVEHLGHSGPGISFRVEIVDETPPEGG